MTNVHDQAAKMRAEADRAQRVEEYAQTLPEDKRDAYRQLMSEIAANNNPAPAPAAPASVPIPGHADSPSGIPSSAPAQVRQTIPEGEQKRLDSLEQQRLDPWALDLRHDAFPGVATAEVTAAQTAYDEYLDYVEDHRDVLAEDWATSATNRDAKLIEKALEDGRTPPKADSFDKAAKQRPTVLATARRMRREVERLDDIARRAVKDAAPEAHREYLGKANEAVREAEQALAALTGAVGRFNQLNYVATELAIKSQTPTPTARDSMRLRARTDVGYAVQEIAAKLRDAAGRTRVQEAEEVSE